MYYRQEPPELYRQRPYVQQAPPAYRRSYPAPYPPPYSAPYRTPAQPVPGGGRPPPQKRSACREGSVMARSASWAALALVALLPVTACTTTVEPVPTVVFVPTESTGTLVVEWTIRAGTDPGDCSLAGAAAIRIHVVTIDVRGCGDLRAGVWRVRDEHHAGAWDVRGVGTARRRRWRRSYDVGAHPGVHDPRRGRPDHPDRFPANSFF